MHIVYVIYLLTVLNKNNAVGLKLRYQLNCL